MTDFVASLIKVVAIWAGSSISPVIVSQPSSNGLTTAAWNRTAVFVTAPRPRRISDGARNAGSGSGRPARSRAAMDSLSVSASCGMVRSPCVRMHTIANRVSAVKNKT